MIYPKKNIGLEDIGWHYDELDPFYRKLWGTQLHHGYWKTGRESQAQAVENLVELVAGALNIKPGDALCDIGCGYGDTVRQLVTNWGVIGSGLTLSKMQYEHACLLAIPNASYFLGDWQTNAFPSSSFDHLISIESSEHMLDKERFFQEMFRVLRPSGHVAICAWLTRSRPSAWEERFLLEPICREGQLASMGSAEEYMQLMERAGFKQVVHRNLTAQVKKTWWLCAGKVIENFCLNAQFRRFVCDHKAANASFAKTVFRILSAYQLGSMQYGLFTAEKT